MLPVRQVLSAQQARQAHRVFKATLEPLAHKVFKVTPERLDQPVQPARRAFKAMSVLQEPQAQ